MLPGTKKTKVYILVSIVYLMSLSGNIAGIIALIIGVVLIIVSIIANEELIGTIVMLFYSLILLGVGIYLLFFNKNEDKIEQINTKTIKRREY